MDQEHGKQKKPGKDKEQSSRRKIGKRKYDKVVQNDLANGSTIAVAAIVGKEINKGDDASSAPAVVRTGGPPTMDSLEKSRLTDPRARRPRALPPGLPPAAGKPLLSRMGVCPRFVLSPCCLVLAFFGRSWSRAAKRNPWRSSFLLCFVKGMAADLVAQMVIEGRSFRIPFSSEIPGDPAHPYGHTGGVSWFRNIAFAFYSGVYMGLVAYFMYNVVYRRVFGEGDVEEVTSSRGGRSPTAREDGDHDGTGTRNTTNSKPPGGGGANIERVVNGVPVPSTAAGAVVIGKDHDVVPRLDSRAALFTAAGDINEEPNGGERAGTISVKSLPVGRVSHAPDTAFLNGGEDEEVAGTMSLPLRPLDGGVVSSTKCWSRACLFRVLGKVCTEELLHYPFVALPLYFAYHSWVHHGDPRRGLHRYFQTHEGWDVLIANWMIWPAFDVLNFTVVPAHMRVTLVACVSFFWCITLSFLSHRKIQHLL